MKRILFIYTLLLSSTMFSQEANIVKSDYTVSGNNTITATNSITLKPTTWIQLGSTFRAYIVEDPYTPLVFSNENYVFTRAYQNPMTSPTGITQNKDVQESITYFDGLGRAKQSIAIQAGGVLTNNEIPKDIVTHIEYDEFGRQTKEYLPYAVESANGAIITGDVVAATNNYYKTNFPADIDALTPNPYSEKQLDNSPLNRILKQAAPGEDWKLGNGHEIEFVYDVNTATEVKNYYVTTSFADNTYTPTLKLSTVNNGNYTTGELYKTVTKDENHGGGTSKLHTTEEFKNKQGQVILKRTFALVAAIETPHDTYYVYDDFGNLTYVLPPKAEAQTDKPTTTELNELCYQYVYDHRNRLVEKKIPGKGWEYIVYDKLDRPVLTQDANLRSVNNNTIVDDKKWLFTKYDALGRVIYTGIYTHGSVITRKAMQTYFDSQNTSKQKYYEEKLPSVGTFGIYYSNSDFPSTSIEVFTVNYYDNYTFDRAGANTSVSNIYGVNSTTNLKSLATGSKVKVLGSSPTKWITTLTYYDEKARPIYVYSKNDELETTDIVESKLDFSGKVLETKTTHKKSGNTDIVIVDTFNYDHMGRVLEQAQKINSQATETIASNVYDQLGQLKTKKVGGTLQEVDYSYNIRGWLKNINQDEDTTDNDLFNFSIEYNHPTDPLKALYNGNIAQTSWNTLNVDSSSKTYTYSYDALNRITGATGTPNSNYNVSGITYDKNGNIIALNRNGWQNSTTFTDMDKLVYTYDNGNKLIKVLDNGNDNYGFKDGANTTTEYTYDANGNMKTDANKGITNITYNHLNLPVNVTLAGGTISYTYDATGNKLRKVANSTTTEYAGNYKYENGTLEFFNHAEGYVQKDGNSFSYVYQYKDHLGNVRLSYTDANNDGTITASTEIIEESNYYPFGLKHKGYNNVTSPHGNSLAQKWGYNGKEYQDDLVGGTNLNWHDFGARNYDAALGRWMNLDPKAEEMRRYSPYNYAFNNPIYFIDPDGMKPVGGPGDLWRSIKKTIRRDVASASGDFKRMKSDIKKFFGFGGKSSKSSLGKGGINFVSASGTNAGQKKGDNSIPTVNADDIIGLFSWGSHSKGSSNVDKMAENATTVLNKVTSFVENVKNGLGDGDGADKIVNTVTTVVKTLTSSNTAGEPNTTEKDSVTIPLVTYKVTGVNGKDVWKATLKDTTVAKDQSGNVLRIGIESHQKAKNKADEILSGN